MKRIYLHALMLTLMSASLFFTPGCCSIMTDSTYPVSIRTFPKNADVTIRNMKTGVVVCETKSPDVVRLPSGAGYFSRAQYEITARKDGYAPSKQFIEAKLKTGWYWGGNFLIGGAIGWLLVDPVTGAMWGINEKDVTLQLMRESDQDEQEETVVRKKLKTSDVSVDEKPQEGVLEE